MCVRYVHVHRYVFIMCVCSYICVQRLTQRLMFCSIYFFLFYYNPVTVIPDFSVLFVKFFPMITNLVYTKN